MNEDKIAVRMAQSLLLHPQTSQWSASQIAQEAYRLADALIAESDRRFEASLSSGEITVTHIDGIEISDDGRIVPIKASSN